MKIKKHLLVIGPCGSGKTWLIKQLMNELKAMQKCKFNLIRFVKKDSNCFLGVFDGSVFDGGDKLSMAVSVDFQKFEKVVNKNNWRVICEGDRFMNENFIKTFNPYIIKIKDNGAKGRLERGSKQTSQHLKRIETRVNNIVHDFEFHNSTETLEFILKNLL